MAAGRHLLCNRFVAAAFLAAQKEAGHVARLVRGFLPRCVQSCDVDDLVHQIDDLGGRLRSGPGIVEHRLPVVRRISHGEERCDVNRVFLIRQQTLKLDGLVLRTNCGLAAVVLGQWAGDDRDGVHGRWVFQRPLCHDHSIGRTG
uniref:Uncharacterized protein n=1 Tax=Ixodes ricinus TaxID=34613 RepID=A0A6B0UUT4_IXORI